MRALLLALLLAAACPASDPPVYWLLWFDTEDFIDPAADDAALRLARELTARGIQATFKVVGEKARVLQRRGRSDVIRALSAHEIGYHSEFHSLQPVPAVYMNELGLLDGAAEFERREGPGFRLVSEMFGRTPAVYGQPGNSWAPQANLALRRWGVPVYMDDGGHVGLDRQPIWFGGLLYVYNLGPFTVRANLNRPEDVAEANAKFDRGLEDVKRRGGGVMQTYYHPCEFSSVEFWDGVNFRAAARPEPSEWKLPRPRTPESQALAYSNFLAFIDHVRSAPGVRIVTPRELLVRVEPPVAAPPAAVARRLADSIDTRDGFSAAEQLLVLLGLAPRYVDGPARRTATTWNEPVIPRAAFTRATRDAAAFIEANLRLPDALWLDSRRLSLPDFAATLAADPGGPQVPLRKAALGLEAHVASSAAPNYNWVIHPPGFAPEALLDLARLQAWTLKPARLRPQP
jgi:hypothetical protein